jgi:hypothetical protein
MTPTKRRRRISARTWTWIIESVIVAGLLLALFLLVRYVWGDAERKAWLPDPALTPGDTLEVTARDVCTPGYAGKVRDVPVSVKRAVWIRYGYDKPPPGEWEIDHFVPLTIGGSNSILNLWPEPGAGRWNFHVKDRLEFRLHMEVCGGTISLAAAQEDIRRDWTAAYRKRFGEPDGEAR